MGTVRGRPCYDAAAFPILPMPSAVPALPHALSAVFGPAAALGSAFTWAFASVIYTQAAKSLGPPSANLLRSLTVLPIYALLALALHGPSAFVHVQPGVLGWLTLSTICSFALGDLVFYMAAIRLGTPTALAIAAVYPVWATLAGAVALGETLTRTRILGLLCCVAGVVWLIISQRSVAERSRSGPPSDADRSLVHGSGDGVSDSHKMSAAGRSSTRRARTRRYAVGLLLSLLTSLMWAGNSYALRQAGTQMPFLVVNALRFSLASIALYIVFRAQGGDSLRTCAGRLGAARRFYVTVLIEALGGSSLFVYALSSTDLSIAAPLCSLAPLFAVPIGVVMRTDRLSGNRVLAICVTMAGVIALLRG